ncbi:AT-rich interactive domain-containing protein 3A-like [Megalops cyprinoides]|uniref:AT-rich interactive domain-containing protein 3A-like n=1 Tax=Megalops cyprinoides TaxID=118141 RepID=UPI001864011E|nr:AT-rich interactive domain-containing protein 3A-like [Megalops cyprinoides]
MVENTSIATKSALQAAFSTAKNHPLLASAHHHISGSQSHPPSGGMKLEAVMENLQRQQAARLALEEKLRHSVKEKGVRAIVESQMQQQAIAFHQYQAAVRGSLAAGAPDSRSAANSPYLARHALHRRTESSDDPDTDDEPAYSHWEDAEDQYLEEDDFKDHRVVDEDTDEDLTNLPRHSLQKKDGHDPKGVAVHVLSGVGLPSYPAPKQPVSPGGVAAHIQTHQHEWTYEEQFKQLYELDGDEKRKEFLDDLFSFMQRRGTPVNRIPIMAKQVLDLYTLYKLVTEKGGLVEVINKKIWREITKGLNLPTSITSAAFTLRTQYVKYLYPYECEKRGLSSPDELQAAIDGNRREGRRQGYGSALFNYSPVGTPTILSSPKIQMPPMSMTTANGSHIAQALFIKKEEPMLSSCRPGHLAIPIPLSGQHMAAAQAAAAAQALALEQLREELESGEPPEKKMMLLAEEQQRIMQHRLQQNLFAMATQLPMNIKLNSRDDRQETALNLSTNCISSINMSIEINGVVYTGLLFGRKQAIPVTPGNNGSSLFTSQGKSGPGLPAHIQSSSSSSSSHGHASSSSSP